ncbi:hypothetical protein tb265_47860 [Gemmatimonadetes bacterium T265]|nr:hypothetical protein tb265_47860 [Gemmatimonadetes bacterium T265]
MSVPHVRGTRRELALALPALVLAAIAAAAPSDTTVVRGVGFRGPENLVYDSAADVYLVANVNGNPTARDGNGFISRVAPTGRVLDLAWIRGGRGGATLDAPMGLAIRGDTLAVCDLAGVRFFDRRTGRALGVVPTPGLRLNDLAYADDGSLWITDTGPDRHVAHGALQVDTTRDLDAVYRIVPGRVGGAVHIVARGLHLQRPDGVTPWPGGRVLVTTFGDSVLERVGPADSSKLIVLRLPGGRVDGLRPAPGGGWFVSSWDARTVYRWRVGDPLLPVLTGVTSPAGIAVDTRRGRLAVTSMQENALYLVPLPPNTRP